MEPDTSRRQRIHDILGKLLIIEGLILLAIAGWSLARQYQVSAALVDRETEDGVLLAVTATDPSGSRHLPLTNGEPAQREAGSSINQPAQPDEGDGEQASLEPAKFPSEAEVSYLPSFEEQDTTGVSAEATPAIEISEAAPTTPTRIVAPAIGLDAEVIPMGWKAVERNGQIVGEWVIPDYAAGWHKNSALPGTGGNTVLSGHNNIAGEVFRYLENFEMGDEITLYAGDQTFLYRVEEKYIVREAGMPEEVRRRNAQWMMPTEDERLTLISCWPYWTNTHRIIIVARPAKGPDVGPVAPQEASLPIEESE